MREGKQIILAEKRGFCGGVNRAIGLVNEVLAKHKAPIYIRHQIVHNRQVIRELERRGAIFVEDLGQIPNGSVLIISAHGCAPAVYKTAKQKNLILYDATCPLVKRVHEDVKMYGKLRYHIIYVGYKKHPEAEGVMEEVKKREQISVISDSKEAEKIELPQDTKIVILTQTTLSVDETANIIKILQKRFPKALIISGICRATQERQEAVKELAKKTDLILVIGSKESSNSNRLKETAEKAGTTVYLIDTVSDIKPEWFIDKKRIGITAGASTPEYIIKEVIKYLENENIK